VRPALSYAVAVLGPGGVGGFLAALLARAGAGVTVLAGDETAREIDRRGLRLESDRFGTIDVRVATAGRLTRSVDAILVAVKATHLADALPRVPRGSIRDAIVVPFLNGLDHVDRLRRAYPPPSVVPATIRIETTRVEAGLIRHTSPFAIVEMAPAEGNREPVERLAGKLRGAGLDVRIRDDEHAMLWDKFALLAPFALLTTHERAGAGDVRTRRRVDLVAVLRETCAVAGAEGVNVDPDGLLALIDSMPPAMESSMQRDQAAGRPTELDALGDALLRRAALHGVDAPVATRIVGELRARAAPRG
jgi:2-dehydropantoate 2-reductase